MKAKTLIFLMVMLPALNATAKVDKVRCHAVAYRVDALGKTGMISYERSATISLSRSPVHVRSGHKYQGQGTVMLLDGASLSFGVTYIRYYSARNSRGTGYSSVLELSGAMLRQDKEILASIHPVATYEDRVSAGASNPKIHQAILDSGASESEVFFPTTTKIDKAVPDEAWIKFNIDCWAD